MAVVPLCCAVALVLAAPAAAGKRPIEFGGGAQATFDGGGLVQLTDAAGQTLVRRGERPTMATVHRGTTEYPAVAGGSGRRSAADAALRFEGLPAATGQWRAEADRQTGELIVRQSCDDAGPGVWGIGWSVAEVPLEFSILVPGRSGVKLDRHSVDGLMTFDYPLGWEAQLVVVEGPRGGFYVFADDAAGRYKRLVVERGPRGWRLRLVTMNDAPFDARTGCESVAWRVGVYAGDWRTAARRYRTWMTEHFRPAPLDEQRPAWVRQIGACIIIPLREELLAPLASRFVPQQTLLYLPDWRQAGYDRDYPAYDAPRPALAGFLARARQLGFRTMLHVNYFGVDPLHPLYERFKQWHVRSPWGDHEHQWWHWKRATPEIRFAYINPAAKAWRGHFVAEMTALVRRCPIDALHLDQTLCIYNDHNGRIDGLSMLEGNVALHRELRNALPDVALSGEGLNEATCRMEAFAQRHAWGLNHAEGTFSLGRLRMAHPISAYLFSPFTVVYGYLGYAPPTAGQLYAAWNEAYEHWGVIPTLRMHGEVHALQGFARQLFDEVAFWQRHRPRPDLDAEWPADAAFVFRAADGRPVLRTVDGRLTHAGQTVSWTVGGQNQVRTSGHIPGWPAYDGERIVALDPSRWYAWSAEPPPPAEFRIAAVPEGFRLATSTVAPELAAVELQAVERRVASLTGNIETAICGSRRPDGGETRAEGPLRASDGALFIAEAERLVAHPPWKDGAAGGAAYARFRLALPKRPAVFEAEVALAERSAGKSDGVAFAVTAWAGRTRLTRSTLHRGTDAGLLRLDLAPLAGMSIELELSVAPGPRNNASFDAAVWVRPQVVEVAAAAGRVEIVSPHRYTSAVSGATVADVIRDGDRQAATVALPATVFFLRESPDEAALPVDLAVRSPTVATVDEAGGRHAHPEYGGVARGKATVGGVARRGLRAHPPDFGRSIAWFPLRLPQTPAVLRAYAGIGDGSKSDGVRFSVAVNGRRCWERLLTPGAWTPVEVDLAAYRGTIAVVEMATDSAGSFSFDWAAWGEPRIERAD